MGEEYTMWTTTWVNTKEMRFFKMEKQKQRLLSLVLALVMALSLCACGAETTVDSNDSSNNGDVSEVTDDSSSSSVSLEKNEATFESLTIVDDENITVKVESFDSDEQSFNLYLENKTTDKTLMFSVDDVSVNGIMCDPYWAKEIDSGLKTYSEMDFSTLSKNGINYIESVELTFRVYDSDDWSADDIYKDVVTLTVTNTTTEPSTFAVASENGFEEVVLVDESDIRIVAVDFDADYMFGPGFLLFIENNTDLNIMVSVDDVGVNGFACDPYWAKSVSAGKSAYSYLSWYDSTLETNNIESIETVTMTLSASDDDDWSADDIINVSVELSTK